jgi:hypothetical protein
MFETHMKKSRTIWNHEVRQADKIARKLIPRDKGKLGWRLHLLPFSLGAYFRYKRGLFSIRKNLLFTKGLAFDAAKEVVRGKERFLEMRFIELKTKEILDKGGKGFYTEKVRRKQLQEIELLVDHYAEILRSEKDLYEDRIRTCYSTKKKYQSFLNKLHEAEHAVIQAAVSSLRKGSKKEREAWFKKVEEVSRNARMEEVKKIFPHG